MREAVIFFCLGLSENLSPKCTEHGEGVTISNVVLIFIFSALLIDVPHPVTTAADNLPEQSGTRGARTNSLDQQHHHRYSCSHPSRRRNHCHRCHHCH